MSLSNDERDELRSTARSLLARESSSERVRATIAEPAGFDRALWDTMIELGWTTIHVPADRGGAGCGYGDLAVVLHELGRAITPSPFLASAVLATGALLLADDGGVARRAARVAGQRCMPSVRSRSRAPTARTTSRVSRPRGGRTGGSLRLNGAAGFVLDADLADVLVVAAARRAGHRRRGRGRHDRRPACASSARRRSTRRAGCSRCRSTTSSVAGRAHVVRAGRARGGAVRPSARPRRDRGRVRRGRRRRAGARTRVRLREGANAVRQADRFVPGGEAPLRQHGDRGRGESRGHPRGRRGARRRPGRVVDDRRDHVVVRGPGVLATRARSRCWSTAGSASPGSTTRTCCSSA